MRANQHTYFWHNPFILKCVWNATNKGAYTILQTRQQTKMRAQLRTASNDRALALCPVIHNISGQLVMDCPVNPSYIQGAGIVCHKKNFGNTRCLYSVTGNILFRPGKIDMVFKGVRSVPAMCQTLTRATGGNLVNIRVSMLVMTIQLQRTFSVREQSPLEIAIMRHCGKTAVQMLPRTEEESNALIFRISKWAVFLPGDPQLAATMDSLNSIVSMSRMGNCTLRSSSSFRGGMQTWLDTQNVVHYALKQFAMFILQIDLLKT